MMPSERVIMIIGTILTIFCLSSSVLSLSMSSGNYQSEIISPGEKISHLQPSHDPYQIPQVPSIFENSTSGKERNNTTDIGTIP